MTRYLSCQKAGPLWKLHRHQSYVCRKQVCPRSEFLYYFIRCIRNLYRGQQFLLIQPTKIKDHGKKLARYLGALRHNCIQGRIALPCCLKDNWGSLSKFRCFFVGQPTRSILVYAPSKNDDKMMKMGRLKWYGISHGSLASASDKYKFLLKGNPMDRNQ